MITNKWIALGLGLLTVVMGYLGTVDWAHTVAPTMAGSIIMAIGAIRAVLGAIQPPSSQTTLTSTGGTIFTHT
jgi:hypothetical protein